MFLYKLQHYKILFLFAIFFGLSNSTFADDTKNSNSLNLFCSKVEKTFKKFNWGKSNCQEYSWNTVRNSVLGDPLVWTIFGDVADEGKESFKTKDVSVIFCGVHGDEITPIKFCFDIMDYLKSAYADTELFKKDFQNKVVIVAPIVNPDSYFKAKPTRVNAHGIDVNRNFATKDWSKDARRLWLAKFKKDKRRNPGISPNSEPEVVFQTNLIKRYGPDKIISVHSPLTMLDYDGPNTIVDGFVDGTKAQELLIQMSKDASDYKIVNYPYFPGSLGNWAGKERDIPTYTLELPTSDPAKSTEYWKLFKSAIHKAIAHDLKEKRDESNQLPQSTSTSPTDKTDESSLAGTKSAGLDQSVPKKID